jgi:CRISPR-associated protein Cas1
MPLAYDFQEPFRWLVDLSVLEVIRDGKLDRKADFIVTENYHIRLRPAASKALMDRLSVNMNRKVPVAGRSFAFETLIQETARKLSRHLTGAKGKSVGCCKNESGVKKPVRGRCHLRPNSGVRYLRG